MNAHTKTDPAATAFHAASAMEDHLRKAKDLNRAAWVLASESLNLDNDDACMMQTIGFALGETLAMIERLHIEIVGACHASVYGPNRLEDAA